MYDAKGNHAAVAFSRSLFTVMVVRSNTQAYEKVQLHSFFGIKETGVLFSCVLDSGLSGPGWNPHWILCIDFVRKTL